MSCRDMDVLTAESIIRKRGLRSLLRLHFGDSESAPIVRRRHYDTADEKREARERWQEARCATIRRLMLKGRP